MKKILSFVFMILITVSVFSVERTNGQNGSPKGSEVKAPVSGKFVQMGNRGLPSCYDENVLLMDSSIDYYFKGEKCSSDYQLIMSGITFNREILSLKKGDVIAYGASLGTVETSPYTINIRTKELSPVFCDTAVCPPVYEKGWYYVSVGMLMSSTAKCSTYQPVTSKKDLISFSDYDESLEELYKSCTRKDNEGKIVWFSQFPQRYLRIKTKLNSYPVSKFMPQGDSPMQGLLIRRNYPALDYCTTTSVIDFDGIPMRLFWQPDFDKYLQSDYKLGDDVYLYIYLMFCGGDEFYCYVREYVTEDPDSALEKQIQRVTADVIRK